MKFAPQYVPLVLQFCVEILLSLSFEWNSSIFSKIQHKIEALPICPPLGKRWLCCPLCSLFCKCFCLNKGLDYSACISTSFQFVCWAETQGSKKQPSQIPLLPGFREGLGCCQRHGGDARPCSIIFHFNCVKAIWFGVAERMWHWKSGRPGLCDLSPRVAWPCWTTDCSFRSRECWGIEWDQRQNAWDIVISKDPLVSLTFINRILSVKEGMVLLLYLDPHWWSFC